MIRKIGKQDRAKAVEYLHALPVSAMPIYEGMKYYGLESEDFALWGDFWADGEIKCLFARTEDVIYIFSSSPTVETMEVYTYLRDNYISYKCVIGQAEKVRGYQRHILFREKLQHSSMVLSKKALTVPEFSRQKAAVITEDVVAEVLELLQNSGDFTAHSLTPQAVMKYTAKYGGYYVRSRGKVVSVGIATANLRKLLYLGVMVTDDMYKSGYGYTEMIAARIAQGAFSAGYSGICTDNVSPGYEEAFKRLGFQSSSDNLLLKR